MASTPLGRAVPRGTARAIATAVGALLALLAGGSPALAQRLPFTDFTADQGLPGTQVWAVHQDSRGFLWVGTTWGLARLAGDRISTLSVPEGLPSPTVRAIVEDSSGQLWLGTQDGVARYDGSQISTVALEDDSVASTIWAAAIDAHGQPWFGSETGLLVAVDGKLRRFTRADGLPIDYVYALFAAADGRLWIGTRGGGAATCRPLPAGRLEDCRTLSGADGLGSDVVRAFAELEGGGILIGTRGGGVSVWRDGRLEPLRIEPLPSRDVYALLASPGGEVVVGTADGGLVQCIGADSLLCRPVDESNGLPENGVRALFEDREGMLWVGTEGGLARLEEENTWSYDEADGLPDRQVYAVEAEPDGSIWVGTFQGLARLRPGPHGETRVRVWQRPDGLPGRWVQALFAERPGRLWIGLENGVARLDGDRVVEVGIDGGLRRENVFALVRGPEGDIWAGTTGGVYRMRSTAGGGTELVRRYTREDGLYADRAYDLEFDAGGRLWVAHGEALTWLDGERFRSVGPEAGLPAHTVRSLGLDRQGALLAGGYGYVARQLTGSDPPRFEAWTRAAGLTDALVLTAAELGDGRLLLGTNRGVLVLDPGADEGRGSVVLRIDSRRGAIGTEVSHSSALARDPRGRIWIGFKGGLTSFPGELANGALEPPAVSFVRVASSAGRLFLAPFTAVVGGPMGWLGDTPAEFPPGDSDLRVEVEPLTFRDIQDLRYQFRLADRDASWSDARFEPFRDFTNLDPGGYAIEARAARGRGSWGPVARLELELRPAWWQTTGARVGGALLFVAALVGGVRWRLASAARRTRRLERQVAERTDDLERYARALAEHLQTIDRANERSRRGLRARRELFARTSHELRTPLTAILGFSDLLDRALDAELGERERRYLANIRDGGEHLLRLVNNLLDQLKLEEGRMEVELEEVALDTMIESVVSLMEGFALHRDVRLEAHAEPGLTTVRVDVAKLRQILLNLLSNAVKFSPAGELVRLVARPAPPEKVPGRRPGYELAVEDRGSGIAPEELESVFEPYRQLVAGDALAPGTGLGLSIARQLVELMGGRIEVESAPGEGSRFRVFLPIDAGLRPASPGRVAESAEGRPRLLLVEPERGAFRILAQRLERDQMLAVRAKAAADADRMLAELRPAALVVRVDPSDPGAWDRFDAAVEVAIRRRIPMTLLVMDNEGLGLALSLDLVVAAERPREAAESALEVFAPARRAGAAPLALLVAAGRERGVALATEVRRAGAEAFRVEGESAVIAAFAEAPGDLLALDLGHLLRLAPEVGGGRSSPALGYGRPKILLAGDRPDEVDLLRLRARLRGEGGEAGLALVGSARALIERSRLRATSL